jgi:hypothetical protein
MKKGWHILKRFWPEVVLVFLIPLFTIGFNLFERTSFYDGLIGLKNLNSIVEERFLQMDFRTDNTPGYIQSGESEFNDMWNLIKKNTAIALPADQNPQVISAFSTKNDPSVVIPTGSTSTPTKTVYLMPENDPVGIAYCSWAAIASSNCVGQNTVIVIGSVDDIKTWIQNTRDQFSLDIDLFISIISAAVGLISIFIKVNKLTI